MNCKDLKILLSACANNELSTSELETVNAHLADCSDCKATLSTFQAVRQQISSLQDLSVKFDIKDAVMADIKSSLSDHRLKAGCALHWWQFRLLLLS